MNSLSSNSPLSFATRSLVFCALPRDIWALGLGSMFMDISSELIHSLLPVFMATIIGASMVTIGIIEGVAEATAAIAKVFSGTLSDYLGKRKSLLVLGYALASFAKPVFPLATSIGWVFAARVVDRIGKASAARRCDALVADIAPPELRGAGYGLRQALDSVGAFIGPLLAVAFMVWFANDIRAVMWVAVVPAFITVALLVLYVHEGDAAQTPVPVADAKWLPRSYWLVVLLGAVFTLARFSEAFLVLRAQDIGLAVRYVPLMLIVMNIFYAALAYPAVAAADRVSRRTLLIIGLALLIAADLVLPVAAAPLLAFVGAALWGLHMALTQGLLAKLVADTAPVESRGTAFGIFNAPPSESHRGRAMEHFWCVKHVPGWGSLRCDSGTRAARSRRERSEKQNVMNHQHSRLAGDVTMGLPLHGGVF